MIRRGRAHRPLNPRLESIRPVPGVWVSLFHTPSPESSINLANLVVRKRPSVPNDYKNSNTTDSSSSRPVRPDSSSLPPARFNFRGRFYHQSAILIYAMCTIGPKSAASTVLSSKLFWRRRSGGRLLNTSARPTDFRGTLCRNPHCRASR